ncbi:MAG: ATP-binding protein [Spirochaetaceae bacterium]|nr:ATP-binding protein [Spirochaetaceae bacterium]
MAGLRTKIAYSYLFFTAVIMATVMVTSGIRSSVALERHTQAMEAHFTANNHLEEDLRSSFSQAIQEVIGYSMVIATTAAFILTFLLSRRVVNPILELSKASLNIAGGHLEERVEENGNDELAQLARSFNKMAYELESTEQRRMQLIGDVAHELRTPLTGIISSLEGMDDGVLEKSSENLNDVLSEAGRLKRLVRDLEVLSRLSADSISIKTDDFDLLDFLEAMIRRVEPQFDGKGIKLSLTSESQDNSIRTDPERLSQILYNLLNNALRYTPGNGSVDVRLRKMSGVYSIVISDTGLGIGKDDLNRIFERFYRVDPSRTRETGGSGIGLAVSMKLAHHLKGKLTATSDGLNQGSTFTLQIPTSET